MSAIVAVILVLYKRHNAEMVVAETQWLYISYIVLCQRSLASEEDWLLMNLLLENWLLMASSSGALSSDALCF